MIMAGGRGSRLGPLTCHRSKPAVPFGGRYRIIDFVLSNFVNSGYRRIYVLTQFMATSLIKYLNRNWRLSGFDEFIEIVPAQMRLGASWYRGTADSVYQNLNLLRDDHTEHVAVFGGDHIYKFAIDKMEKSHRQRDADLSVATFPVPRSEAHQFGICHVDETGRITGFIEKPSDPPEIPGRPGWCLVSMGNYIFRYQTLMDVLTKDAEDSDSNHDFGRNIIPRLVAEGSKVYAYDFATNQVPGEPTSLAPYWRDVGTLDSYFEANMDLRERLPPINMYNRGWRVHTAQRDYPPARFVREGATGPASEVIDSLVCEGSIVSSSVLREVVVGYDCFVHANSMVENSMFLSGCDVGRGAKVSGLLCDKNCHIAPGSTIGVDPELDRKRFPFITEGGIIVLPKGTHVPAEGPIEIAHDINKLMLNDEDWGEKLRNCDYTVSAEDRHSFVSSGPRFESAEGATLSVDDV